MSEIIELKLLDGFMWLYLRFTVLVARRSTKRLKITGSIYVEDFPNRVNVFCNKRKNLSLEILRIEVVYYV